jgi:hypothetical protein
LWCGLNCKPVNPDDSCEEYVDKTFIIKEVVRLSKKKEKKEEQ